MDRKLDAVIRLITEGGHISNHDLAWTHSSNLDHDICSTEGETSPLCLTSAIPLHLGSVNIFYQGWPNFTPAYLDLSTFRQPWLHLLYVQEWLYLWVFFLYLSFLLNHSPTFIYMFVCVFILLFNRNPKYIKFTNLESRLDLYSFQGGDLTLYSI